MSHHDVFSNSTLMITGGTGSFGSTTLRHFWQLPVREIRIVSRDEKKQDDRRRRFGDGRVKCNFADVRDPRAIDLPCRGVDFVHHTAALKQVPSCEFHPTEAVATNVLGTANVIYAALRHVLSGETLEIVASADAPTAIETIPGWSHDITNVGDGELVALVWASETYHRGSPDTVVSPL